MTDTDRLVLIKDIEELKKSPWYNNKEGFFYRKEAIEIVVDLCIKKRNDNKIGVMNNDN